MLAARANLPIDRLNDAVLLSDTIAANVCSGFGEGRVRVEIGAGSEGLELCVGPLASDGAALLRQSARIPEAGDVLERLANAVSVEQRADGEYLVLDVAA
jgi:serine/threonine-protein kinase RsbW